jgi:mannose-6-phosphate isomerase-like protein (cupin superfamily)
LAPTDRREEGVAMPRKSPRSFDPESTYAFLEDGGAASSFPGGERFWRSLAAGPPFAGTTGRVAEGAGWLAALYAIERDGGAWERHPNGGELLAMVTGAMDVVLDLPTGEATVPLEAGRAVLVPQGVWHRQVVRTPGTYFGVTFGKGSEHRPLGDGRRTRTAARKPVSPALVKKTVRARIAEQEERKRAPR